MDFVVFESNYECSFCWGIFWHLPTSNVLFVAVAPSEFFLPPSTTAPKEKSSSIPLKIEHRSVASSFDNTLKTCVSDIMQSNSTSALVRPSGFLWPSHFYVSLCVDRFLYFLVIGWLLFQKPSLSEWFAAAIHLHSLLFHGDEFRSLLDSKLGSTMSISRKYSRSVAAFSINSFTLRTTESGVRQVWSIARTIDRWPPHHWFFADT